MKRSIGAAATNVFIRSARLRARTSSRGRVLIISGIASLPILVIGILGLTSNSGHTIAGALSFVSPFVLGALLVAAVGELTLVNDP